MLFVGKIDYLLREALSRRGVILRCAPSPPDVAQDGAGPD
jgi:hypothetical protein